MRPAALFVTALGVLLTPALALADDPPAPFSEDYTWMNGQSRQRTFPLPTLGGALTPSLYLDTQYAYSTNHPLDDTLTGGASVGRHNEFQLNLISAGVDWNFHHVIGRISIQYGSTLSIVQDTDGTAARGRSLTVQNLRYIREATLGYHFDVSSGLNVEAGIFMSYIGLESYLLAENWNYTRSMICEHTPFYFQGVRAQYFPTPHIKIEPWLMNGWQSYGRMNFAPSAGMAFRWSPRESFTFIANVYVGTDSRGVPDRVRFHHDHSVVVRYYNRPTSRGLSKAAFSLNNHVGFEDGGAGQPGPSDAYVLGTSLVGRFWFYRDYLAVAVRGELMTNPSGYLTQYPPPGLATGPDAPPLQFWGLTGTFDVMPTDFLTLRAEFSYRRSNVGYFAGPGGTTSPDGFQPTPAGFVPDTRKDQGLFVLAANFRL